MPEQALTRLAQIKWFHHAGQAVTLPDVRQIMTIDDFAASIDSQQWEDTTLEARNDITGRLASKFPQLQSWNTIAHQFKPELDRLLENMPPFNSGSRSLKADLQWNLLSYLMEDHYKDKLKRPLFFERLICIYEAGHIPCGWDGVWPQGQLVIY